MVEVLPAQQRLSEEHWYRGTADAVFQNIDIIRSRSHRHDYVVILAGDHIYKMDYSLMLRDHVANGGGCTVGCIEVPREEATAFGVMAVDEDRRITAFVEKPKDPPPMPGNPAVSLASMGIYIFDADYLYQLLEDDVNNPASTHDFEARYCDWLVGPLPDAGDEYDRRSPRWAVDRVRGAVLLLQGTEDPIVPPEQAATMAAALRARGLRCELLTFEGEGHGFRQAATIEQCLRAEHRFYLDVLVDHGD